MKKISFYSKSLWRTPALAGILLCGLMLMATLPTTGCTQQQKISVAQEIVNWTPVFISTADTVNASIMALDPATIAVLAPITLAINAFGPEFQKAAQAYLDNPNQTTLQVLQALIVQIQQDANSALLAAARIVNPDSQSTALKNLNLVATIVSTLLALIQSISSRAGLLAMSKSAHISKEAARVLDMSEASRVRLSDVRVHMDEAALYRASQKVTTDMGWPISMSPTPEKFFAYEAQSGF